MTEAEQALRNARSGWLWSTLDQFAHRGLGMLVSLVLARLLEPEAFGLIAAVMVFIVVSQQVIDGGIGQRILQKSQIEEADYTALFWATMGLSLLCGGAMALLAAPIAIFYGKTELEPVVLGLAGVLWLSSLGRVPAVMLNRQMRFRSLTLISIGAVLTGCVVGLVLAVWDYGVWALIGQQGAYALTRAAGLWWKVAWVPRLRLHRNVVLDLYRYGLPVFSGQFFCSIADKLINVLIARDASTAELGLFDRGRVIPLNLNGSLEVIATRANLTTLSTLQESPALFSDFYLRTLTVMFTGYLVVLAGLAATSSDVIYLLLGERWQASAWYLKWSCLAFAFQALIIFNGQAMKALGKVRIYLCAMVVLSLFQVAGVVSGLPWSAHGMVIGDTVARGIGCLCFMLCVGFVSDAGMLRQSKALLAPIAAAVLVGGVGYMIHRLSGQPMMRVGLVATFCLCIIVLLGQWVSGGKKLLKR